MSAIETNTVRGILACIGIVLSYGFALVRMFRRYRGDRFIEFGLMTTMLVVVMMAIYRIPNIPDWVVPAFMPLLALLCFSSIFIGLRQAYAAIRGRKRNASGN